MFFGNFIPSNFKDIESYGAYLVRYKQKSSFVRECPRLPTTLKKNQRNPPPHKHI